MNHSSVEETRVADAFAGRTIRQSLTPEFLEHHLPERGNDVDHIRSAITKVESIYNVAGGFVYDSGTYHVFFVYPNVGDEEAAQRAAQELFHWLDKA